MAAVAGASWQKELTKVVLFDVSGPLRVFIDHIKSHQRNPNQDLSDLQKLAMKVTAEFILSYGCPEFDLAARIAFRDKISGPFNSEPIVDGPFFESLPTQFRKAMLKAISVQISSFLEGRINNKERIKEAQAYVEYCRAQAAMCSDESTNLWQSEVDKAEGNLRQLQDLSHCTAPEGQEVGDPEGLAERELEQLREWEKNPEELLRLAEGDPDPEKAKFFQTTSLLLKPTFHP